MAILGLGTDIVEIARIEAVIARSGERLARRVLSDNEWAIWKTHHQPVRFLAKRFAVKEAAAKAFGTGIRNGLGYFYLKVFLHGMNRRLKVFKVIRVVGNLHGTYQVMLGIYH